MSKLLGTLVVLVAFAALPAMALAQTEPSGGGDTVSSGNTQTGTIGQNAEAGHGGNAGNQAAIVQQNAGDDANCSIDQSQSFGGTTNNNGASTSGSRVSGASSHVTGVSGSGGVGGGAQSVTLARTGFDAWVLALIGGVSLAGGLGLLAAQRRGRLSA